MKRFALVVVIVTAFIATAALASGNKYKQTPVVLVEEPVDSESVTSMSDCMTFSAGHKTKGLEGDKSEFNRQFGEPVSKTGNLMTYNYDKYTKVVLDCSKRSCNCRCSPKN